MSEGGLPSISIVVPVYNRAAGLGATVPAVLGQDAAEVIYVDDGSSDGSREVLHHLVRNHSHARVLTHHSNRGRAAARNTGLAEASSEVILFLDVDVRPEEGTARAHAERHRQRGVVGVLSHDEPEGLDPDNPYHRYLSTRAAAFSPDPDRPLHLKHFIIGYTSVRADVLREVGGFEESLSYGEDLELAYRISERYPDSFRFEPAARVHQRDVGTLPEREAELRAFGRHLPELFARHPGLAAAAGLSFVASSYWRFVLHPALVALSRRALAHAPAPIVPPLVRYLLASATLAGYQEASRP